MNPHALVLFVHLLAVVVLLGSGVWLPVMRGAIRRAPDLDALRASLGLLGNISRAGPLAALTILASGLWMASAGWWSAGWFQVALALFVASAVLSVAVVERHGKAMARAAAAAGTGEVPPALDAMRWSRRWELASNALLAIGPVQLFLMTNKPGLQGLIAVVAGSQVLVAIHYLVRGAPLAASARRGEPAQLAGR